MNHSLAIFLISDNARGILATYEAGDKAPRTLFKTLDKNIAVDDLIVVPTETRHGFTICKVVETDVEPNFDKNDDVKWVVCKADRSAYDGLLKQEQEAIRQIKIAERQESRAKLRKSLMDNADEKLKALPLYNVETKD